MAPPTTLKAPPTGAVPKLKKARLPVDPPPVPLDESPPPLVETRSKNYLTIALEEIGSGKIKLVQD